MSFTRSRAALAALMGQVAAVAGVVATASLSSSGGDCDGNSDFGSATSLLQVGLDFQAPYSGARNIAGRPRQATGIIEASGVVAMSKMEQKGHDVPRFDDPDELPSVRPHLPPLPTRPATDEILNVAAPNGPHMETNRSQESDDDDKTPCGFHIYPGNITLIRDEVSGAVAIDITDAMTADGKATVMVTAMTVDGTYIDTQGFWNQVAYPMEGYYSNVFEFKLSPDESSVDVFKPVMDIRTSDDESETAVTRAVGSGWMEVLPRMRTPLCHADKQEQYNGEGYESVYDEDRIIIDASKLIWRGFFVADWAVRYASTYRVEEEALAAYPQNADITVEYLMTDTRPNSPLKIGYSIIVLPETPMMARVNDDRLLYFSTDYTDKGFRQNGPEKLPSQMVDSRRSMIWRYNLTSSNNGGHIRIYVDPTVPERWRKWFRRGIEAWNDGFELAGHTGAVKAVLPEDEDWPADYNLADVRFSTVSWSVSNAVVSAGIAKVDPRSGEILKSDIIMSDGWVKAWLDELDHLAPNLTHELEPELPEKEHVQSMLQFAPHSWPGQRPGRGGTALQFSLLSKAAGNPLSDEQQEDLLGAGIQDVIMHEVGHILGLRHNFKGSLGVAYACTRNATCTAENGLTASVMDYMPMNLPTVDGPDVLPFSPVIGAYDKLAIMYGYMKAEDVPWPQVAPELQEVLEEAERYGTCYDSDVSKAEDPGCMMYDMSDDPLQYFEDLLDTYAEAQRNLLNMSVVPGEPFQLYGRAVDWILKKTQAVGDDLILWLGGINNTYAHRGSDGSTSTNTARRPVSAKKQRRALDLLLPILRPQRGELLPPSKNLPYLVHGDSAEGYVYSYDLDKKIRSMTSELLGKALQTRRVLQVYEQEGLLDEEDAQAASVSPLGVSEYLEKIVSGVIGDGLDVPYTAEWELQRDLVSELKTIYFDKGSDIPEEVQTHVMYHLQRVSDATEAAYLRASDPAETSSGWRHCAVEGQNCTCGGLVRFGAGDSWTAAISVSAQGSAICSTEDFGNPFTSAAKECQCLDSKPASGDLMLSHLRLMRRSLAEVFCAPGDAACLYPRVPAEEAFVQTGGGAKHEESEACPSSRLASGSWIFVAASTLFAMTGLSQGLFERF